MEDLGTVPTRNIAELQKLMGDAALKIDLTKDAYDEARAAYRTSPTLYNWQLMVTASEAYGFAQRMHEVYVLAYRARMEEYHQTGR